jgi:uncharacterized Zn-finger protein
MSFKVYKEEDYGIVLCPFCQFRFSLPRNGKVIEGEVTCDQCGKIQTEEDE